MEKPLFQSWANVVTLWYEHCPGIGVAKREALMNSEVDAMNRLAQIGKQIAIDIGELSVQITALEVKRNSLSKMYKELEKQYQEHSASYDELSKGK